MPPKPNVKPSTTGTGATGPKRGSASNKKVDKKPAAKTGNKKLGTGAQPSTATTTAAPPPSAETGTHDKNVPETGTGTLIPRVPSGHSIKSKQSKVSRKKHGVPSKEKKILEIKPPENHGVDNEDLHATKDKDKGHDTSSVKSARLSIGSQKTVVEKSTKGVAGHPTASLGKKKKVVKPKKKKAESVSSQGEDETDTTNPAALAMLKAPPPIGFSERLFQFFKYPEGVRVNDVEQGGDVDEAICKKTCAIVAIILLIVIASLVLIVLSAIPKGGGRFNDTTTTNGMTTNAGISTSRMTTPTTTLSTTPSPCAPNPPPNTNATAVGEYCVCLHPSDLKECQNCCDVNMGGQPGIVTCNSQCSTTG